MDLSLDADLALVGEAENGQEACPSSRKAGEHIQQDAGKVYALTAKLLIRAWLRLPIACLASADNCLRPIHDLQLGKNV
jgi:hypothetical protein